MKSLNEEGSAILLTLVITLVLYALTESRHVQREEMDLQAYYLARSGADAVPQGIIDNPQHYQVLIGLSSEPVYLGVNGGFFTVKILEENGTLSLTFTGVVGGEK